MNQLTMLGLLPSPTTSGCASLHSAWPLVLVVIAVCAILPMTQFIGKRRRRGGD